MIFASLSLNFEVTFVHEIDSLVLFNCQTFHNLDIFLLKRRKTSVDVRSVTFNVIFNDAFDMF